MWHDELWQKEMLNKNPKCYNRFCYCCNTKNDILTITKFMHNYNNSKSIKECLDRTLLWLTDWNGQINLYPLEDEYNKILSKLEKKEK